METAPTKITRTVRRTPRWVETYDSSTGAMTKTLVQDETEIGSSTSVSSVELKEDAKGSIRVESYKVYANDPAEAERLALEGMMRLRSRVAEATEQQFQQQLHDSVKGAKP